MTMDKIYVFVIFETIFHFFFHFIIKYGILISEVIPMDLFSDITVTAVEDLYTVHFQKDLIVNMKDRPCFGLSFCDSGQLTYTMDGVETLSGPSCAVLLPMGGTYQIHGDKEGIFPVINFRCTGLPSGRIEAIPDPV